VNYDHALSDIAEAERLGILDLGMIVWTKAVALEGRGKRSDLMSAIDLFTVSLQLTRTGQPDLDARLAGLYDVDALSRRAWAEYLVGEYQHEIRDSQTALNLAAQRSVFVPGLFKVITLSNLAENKVWAAIKAATEFESRTGYIFATELRGVLTVLETDPQRALIAARNLWAESGY
jgi:hypothetical protein